MSFSKKFFLVLSIFTLLFFQNKTLSAQVDSSNQSYSILAWNMYLLPAIAPVQGRLTRAEKIIEVLNESNYTILCLQEAFHHKAVANIKKGIQKNYPYQYGPFYETNNTFAASSGLLICSKVPLQIIDSIEYVAAKGIDAKSNKGAIMMQADIADKKFQVILTHMQSGIYSEIRRLQFEQIKKQLIDKYSKENIPLFICGDLNTERKDQVEYEFMLSMLDAKDGANNGELKDSYDGTRNRLAKKVWKNASTNLDYVLLKKNNAQVDIQYTKVKAQKRLWKKNYEDLSDHYGVECGFKLR